MNNHVWFYYESFPLNKRVTFRVLLEHYRTGGDPKQISGYLLMFMKNNGVILDVEASHKINLSNLMVTSSMPPATLSKAAWITSSS
jgi:hypothetical protein